MDINEKCKEGSGHEKLVELAKEHMPKEEVIEQVGARFKVLGEASRLKILTVLMEGELCVAHICEATGALQSATSHQLKILKDNKFLKCRREGKAVLYRIADEHIRDMLITAIKHAEC